MALNDEERAYGPREDEHPDDPVEETPLTTLLPRDDASDDSSPPTPRFIQDQGSYKYLSWVPVPIRRVWKATTKWANGPNPPQIHTIKPVFAHIQEAPIRFLDTYIPKTRHRAALLFVFYVLWILSFSLFMQRGHAVTEIEGWGAPGEIGCGNTYWVPGNNCGMNGNGCRPFNGSGFAFRCPANCATTHVLNHRAVGDQEIIYRALVIGGPPAEGLPPIYRSDSFICGSAIHAGIINNAKGGCGIVSLVGEYANYTSSTHHGIESIGFDSNFPSSFTFHSGTTCEAKDARWSLLFVSLAFTVVLSLFTSSPAVFYFTIFTALFFHVGLASDPPLVGNTAELFSNLIGKFLPAAFCGVVMYHFMGVRRTLTGLTAQIDKTILWLGACWVGALSNYTLDWIPIQRLNRQDLQQQPGAKLALALVILLLTAIIAKQVVFFQREGRLKRYLGIYGLFIFAILMSLTIPGLNLRIHHYILALLLLPGTSMQTRPALFYQGLLIGLFINGIARWGFDPVLQTDDALRGDAPHNSELPHINPPEITLEGTSAQIAFDWEEVFEPFDGISVLVNDVERFRGYKDEGLKSDQKFVWRRKAGLAPPLLAESTSNETSWAKIARPIAPKERSERSEKAPDAPGEETGDENQVGDNIQVEAKAIYNEYFRFAFMQGSRTWDYTRAGVWAANGEWREMEAGPSRARDIGPGEGLVRKEFHHRG
jgi:hypothetical protein